MTLVSCGKEEIKPTKTENQDNKKDEDEKKDDNKDDNKDSKEENPEVKVTALSISLESITMTAGQSYTLTAKVEPDTAKVSWASSSTSVVTVSDEGVLNAIKAGTSTITASAGDLKATCSVTVNEDYSSGTYSVGGYDSNNGGVIYYSELASEDEYYNNYLIKLVSITETKGLTWQKSKEWCEAYGDGSWEMPSIDELKLIYNNLSTVNSAISSAGGTQITLENYCYWSSTEYQSDYAYRMHFSDGKVYYYGSDEKKTSTNNRVRAVKQYTISVDKSSVVGAETALAVSPTRVTIYPDQTYTLTTNMSPVSSWTSSNTSVVKVSSEGVLTGVSAGEATVTAKVGDYTATCKVTVAEKYLNVSPSSVTIYEGDTYELTVESGPSDANIDWSSSNTSVATVSNGVIKGIAVGSATITGTLGNVKATCEVTVDSKSKKNTIYYTTKDGAKISSITTSSTICGASVTSHAWNSEAQAYAIVLSSGFTEMDATFAGTSIKTITLPATVISIAKGAFKSCSSLVSVTNTESITSIGANAFYSCSALEEFNFASTTSIGDDAFYKCTSLKTVDLPRMTSVGKEVFYGCTKLTSISAAKLQSTGEKSFQGCRRLKTISLPVATQIGTYSFADCTSLASFSLPSVTSLGTYAFSGCTALTEFSLPVLPKVSDYAFNGCTSLISMNLPVVTTIGNSAFKGCTSLKGFDLPLVTTVEGSAFSGCSALESFDLSSVTTVGSSAFRGCSTLEKVELPSATEVGGSAFYKCTSLKSASLPEITIVNSCTFYDCSSLTDVNIPKVTELGSSAFIGSGLITFEHSLIETLGESAFSNCKSLKSVYLEKVKKLGNKIFYRCYALESINFPSLVSIDHLYTFDDCTSLKEIILGENFTTGAKYILQSKFTGTFTIYANTPPDFSTSYSVSYATLRVPYWCVEAYKSHSGWGKFGTIETFEY